MVVANDLTITSIETITTFDLHNGDYLFTLDEMQSCTIAQGEDKSDITGRQGRKLGSLHRNKNFTVSGNNGFISGGLLALQTGSEFEAKNDIPIKWSDYLSVGADHTVALSYSPASADSIQVYTLADGVASAKLTATTETPAAGKFKYTAAVAASGNDPATPPTITFNSDLAEGTNVVVFYTRSVSGHYLVNESNKYAGKCSMYIDAMAEDKCNNVYRVQFYIPKAEVSGEFSIDLGDNQAVHAFEASSLSGGCTANNTLWTYAVFGEEQSA